jgi:ParB family transcriptional regulator, chromosome partitioning protein
MNTPALSDSTAPVTPAPAASTDAKPTRKAKAGKNAVTGEATRVKKGKTPRGAKAAKGEKAPRASRKAGRKAARSDCDAVTSEAPPPKPSGEPIAMADVYANPNQPRKLFEQKELEELAASIAQRGLLQPIKVVPRPQPNGTGKYMIVLGERRWRAHQLLGAPTILATVSLMTDDEIADAAIIENLQRKDITPLEEARAYQARLNTGLTVEQLAERLGLKQSWRISERTALLKLTAEHQEAFARGALSPSQAYEMSRLGPTMQRVLFNAIGGGKCRSYAELRKTVEALVLREKQIEMPTEVPGVEPPTEADHERVREVEAMIGKVCELVQKGFDGNDVAILRKVNVANAEVLADKLELIESSLRKIRLELRAAAVARLTAEAAQASEPTTEPAPASEVAAGDASASEPPASTRHPAGDRFVELDANAQPQAA